MEGRESTVSGSPSNTESPVSGGGVVPQVIDMAVNMTIGGGGGSGGPVTGAVTGAGGGGIMEALARKKRGRPRKYSSDTANISYSVSSPHFYSPPSDYSGKRGRGRPAGSVNRQVLSSMGGVSNSAGAGFTPHVLTVNAGEDVSAKISQFAQNGSRAICILSANGSIGRVTIRQSCVSGGYLTYEGRFEILSLSGSYSFADTSGGVRSRSGGLSVSLAGPDGRVVGGSVGGLLTAASPIQIVLGSFVANTNKSNKRKHYLEPFRASTVPSSANVVTAARPISQATPHDENITSPTSLPEHNQGEAENSTSSNHNPNTIPFQNVGWPGTQSASDQKPSPDINMSLHGE